MTRFNGKRDSIFNPFTVPLALGIVAMWQVKIAERSLRSDNCYYYKINLRANWLFSVIITYRYSSKVVQNIEADACLSRRHLLSLFPSVTLKMFAVDAFVKLNLCPIFCSFRVSTSTITTDIYCNNIVLGWNICVPAALWVWNDLAF